MRSLHCEVVNLWLVILIVRVGFVVMVARILKVEMDCSKGVGRLCLFKGDVWRVREQRITSAALP